MPHLIPRVSTLPIYYKSSSTSHPTCFLFPLNQLDSWKGEIQHVYLKNKQESATSSHSTGIKTAVPQASRQWLFQYRIGEQPHNSANPSNHKLSAMNPESPTFSIGYTSTPVETVGHYYVGNIVMPNGEGTDKKEEQGIKKNKKKQTKDGLHEGATQNRPVLLLEPFRQEIYELRPQLGVIQDNKSTNQTSNTNSTPVQTKLNPPVPNYTELIYNLPNSSSNQTIQKHQQIANSIEHSLRTKTNKALISSATYHEISQGWIMSKAQYMEGIMR